MYRALVFLHIEIEDSFFEESNNYIFTKAIFSSINFILDICNFGIMLYYHYSLKDGLLECVDTKYRQCMIVYANQPTLACLDFVKFSHEGKMISYKFIN